MFTTDVRGIYVKLNINRLVNGLFIIMIEINVKDRRYNIVGRSIYILLSELNKNVSRIRKGPVQDTKRYKSEEPQYRY